MRISFQLGSMLQSDTAGENPPYPFYEQKLNLFYVCHQNEM